MSESVQTLQVPHLGGSTIGYRFGRPYDPAKPTLVLVNSFTTSADLYRPQFADPALAAAANLLALEPYGHGQTRTASPQFTYWDSAQANLQVLDVLRIPAAFVLGTSQGGWIAARMAMLAPTRIRGILPLGTSMDAETARSQELGCWDGVAFNTPLIDGLSEAVAADWTPGEAYYDALLEAGLGNAVPDAERAFWHRTLAHNYRGDEGRRRLRVCAINLRDRDGLLARLDAVNCPVLWMHGTEDKVYSIANAEDGIARFQASPQARLKVVGGGQHFLSASHPAEVNAASIAFMQEHAG